MPKSPSPEVIAALRQALGEPAAQPQGPAPVGLGEALMQAPEMISQGAADVADAVSAAPNPFDLQALAQQPQVPMDQPQVDTGMPGAPDIGISFADLAEATGKPEMAPPGEERLPAPTGLKATQVVPEQQEQSKAVTQEQLAQSKAADTQRQAVEAVQQKNAALDTREEDLRAIDPSRFWNNKSTGQKIGIIVGLIAGGIGSGMTGGPNASLALLNKAMDADLDAQKADNASKLAMKRVAMDNIRLKLEQEGARTTNQLKKVQIAQTVQAIEAQQAQSRLAQLAESMDEGSYIENINQKHLTTDQKSRIIPQLGVIAPNASKEEVKTFKKTLSQNETHQSNLRELMILGEKGSSASPADRARANTLAQSLRGMSREIFLGPGTVQAAEREMLNNIIRNPLDVFQLGATATSSLNAVAEGFDKHVLGEARSLGIKDEAVHRYLNTLHFRGGDTEKGINEAVKVSGKSRDFVTKALEKHRRLNASK